MKKTMAMVAAMAAVVMMAAGPAAALDLKLWRTALELDWVHGEEVKAGKVQNFALSGDAEFDLFGDADEGLFVGAGLQVSGLNAWKKNPRNGLEAVLKHDPFTVEEYDTTFAMSAGYDFGPCQLRVTHTNFPDRTVAQGRYNTKTLFGCGAGF